MPDDAGAKADDLLHRAQAGDQRAQDELLGQYRQQLRRMVAIRLDRRVSARVDPSDIVQEALKTAHERLPSYLADPRIPFYPWLRRIAWDRLADVYRTHLVAEKRSVLREHAWTPNLNDESVAELARSIVTSSANPSEKMAEAEVRAKTAQALLELKPQDREILVLRYLEQLGVKEIADVLGISQTAVTSRHLRALQRLRGLLSELGDD